MGTRVPGLPLMEYWSSFVGADQSRTSRIDHGGILKFHNGPGDLVRKGQLLATNHDIFGHQQDEILSPADGIIQGITTMPAVKPGEPVFHIALPSEKFERLKAKVESRKGAQLHHQVQHELATSLLVEHSTP